MHRHTYYRTPSPIMNIETARYTISYPTLTPTAEPLLEVDCGGGGRVGTLLLGTLNCLVAVPVPDDEIVCELPSPLWLATPTTVGVELARAAITATRTELPVTVALAIGMVVLLPSGPVMMTLPGKVVVSSLYSWPLTTTWPSVLRKTVWPFTEVCGDPGRSEVVTPFIVIEMDPSDNNVTGKPLTVVVRRGRRALWAAALVSCPTEKVVPDTTTTPLVIESVCSGVEALGCPTRT